MLGFGAFRGLEIHTATITEGASRETRIRCLSALLSANVDNAAIILDPKALDVPHQDLPRALREIRTLPEQDGRVFAGELALGGQIRAVRGVLPMVLEAKRVGLRAIFVPRDNAREASVVDGIDVYAVDTLDELVAQLQGKDGYPLITFSRSLSRPQDERRTEGLSVEDLFVPGKGTRAAADLRPAYERALTLIREGKRVLLVGPPGSGKTMIARRLSLGPPKMTDTEEIDTTTIYSVVGLVGDRGLIRERPFRAPHHTISEAGLIGGGVQARPGEVSLAHNGILFLDDLPEFKKNTLETLRPALNNGCVTIFQQYKVISFPSRVHLVAAANPCACGGARICSCSPEALASYKDRLAQRCELLNLVTVTL